MQISARNSFKGTIKSITEGEVNAEVVVEVAPNLEITSVITKSSASRLGLAVGKEVYTMVKSTDVIIATD